ncbi:MAG: hypothetical protein HY718_17380 [Planctomycetes bacterium]|nr:hypothetical protein [Planctomycetota bacterium]
MSADNVGNDESVVAALLAVADVLEAEGSPYAVIGALAAAQHGLIRATQDVDLLVAVPAVRLPALLAKLEQSGCQIDQARVIREWTSEHLTQFRYRDVPIDWLEPVIPLFQLVLDRATTRDVLGHPVRFADADGVVLMKLVAFRPGDRQDVDALALACRDVDWTFVRGQLESVFGPDDERLAWLRANIPS